MGLFSRRSKDAPRAGPAPAEMRGRAAEIADPGAFDWEVVWEALKTEPPAEDAETLTQEHGLAEEHEVDLPESVEGFATEFSGTRHGRRVKLRLGVMRSEWRTPATEVEVEAPVAPFRVRADDGRLIAEPGAPEVEEFLASLAPSPDVWKKVEVAGGPDGIHARRPVTAHPQGYVYDLWLVERLADRLGA